MKALFAWVVGSALFVLPGVASAELSASAFGGFGLPPEDGGEDLFRFGLGARAGYSFLIPIYIGGAATFHHGSTDDEAGASRNYLNYYGAEAGVDLTFGPLGLRPYAMGGIASVDTTRDRRGRFTAPYLGLGVMPTWRFLDLPGADLFLGLDARWLQVLKQIENGDTSQSAGGLALYLNVGVRI